MFFLELPKIEWAAGHITSLAVLRTHRKRGIATLLMRRSQLEMHQVFGSEYVSLHVRKSNRAAFHLYTQTLQYEIHDIEKGYYADGEDAYDMRCVFSKQRQQQQLPSTGEEGECAVEEDEDTAVVKQVQALSVS